MQQRDLQQVDPAAMDEQRAALHALVLEPQRAVQGDRAVIVGQHVQRQPRQVEPVPAIADRQFQRLAAIAPASVFGRADAEADTGRTVDRINADDLDEAQDRRIGDAADREEHARGVARRVRPECGLMLPIRRFVGCVRPGCLLVVGPSEQRRQVDGQDGADPDAVSQDHADGLSARGGWGPRRVAGARRGQPTALMNSEVGDAPLPVPAAP